MWGDGDQTWKLKAAVFTVFILPRLLLFYVLPIVVLSVLGGLLFAHFMAPVVQGMDVQHQLEYHQ